jgi:hypothetical protein
MRVELKKLMETLGVGHVLSPYETFPWFHYDSVKGVTCSAEVRMGPGGDDIEAEIQFLYDEGRAPEPPLPAAQAPVPETPPPKKYETYDDFLSPSQTRHDAKPAAPAGPPPISGEVFTGGPIQIMRMRALPTEGLWEPKELRVKGEDYRNKVSSWEEKGCKFFRACVESLQMGILPNIDELIEKELDDDDNWGGGKRGRIGRKAPKIKPAQLLGLNKKGM